jgi:head-tail adaptor
VTAPFRLDEQVTIEQRTVARDPDYGTETESWEIVGDKVWCNAQDVLPSRAESASNGIRTATKQTRLRIRIDDRIAPEMRVTLHGKGGRVMQIIAGPALLDDRRHVEFMLEGYSNGR